MSESHEPVTDQHVPSPRSDAPAPGATPEPSPVDDDTTVGTGTSIALGCIAGTLLLVVIGLIFLAIVFLLG